MHGYKTKNKCTSWEPTKKVKSWNSQTVRKSKESTVNTIRIRIKTADVDYIIVDVPEISGHCRFESGFNIEDVFPEYNFS